MVEETPDDIQRLLSTRHANGADFWATADGKIGIDQPISTLSALLIMNDLHMDRSHEALRGAADLVLAACRPDGRVRIAPAGSMYPCQSAVGAAALCRNGYADDPRTQLILNQMLQNRYEDGGWRCNKFIFGRGPETEHSNPGVTLLALDAFRWAGMHNDSSLDSAVETLLDHWTIRAPIGPCHYGMGSLFMQVEYPFLRYNLFFYVHTLSYYPKARTDGRFLDAVSVLKSKLDDQGRIVIVHPHKKLAGFAYCKKDEPSPLATERYQEIEANLNQPRWS
jgi:hypothetical protein